MTDIIEINGIDKGNNICLIDIYFSDNCNFNCNYCYNVLPRSNKNIDVNALIKWILNFKKKFNINLLFILLTGGEPTLHPNLLYFINFLSKEKNIYISIFSNFSSSIDIYVEILKNKNTDLKITWHGQFNEKDFYLKLLSIDKKYFLKLSVKIMFEKNNEKNSFILIEKISNLELKSLEFSSINYKNCNISYDSKLYLKYIYLTSKIKPTQYIDVKIKNNILKKINDNFFQDNLVENTNFYNWICNAGKTFLFIDINGNIIPCLEGNNKNLGNINDKYITFNLKQSLCKSKICSCLYYISKKKIFK